MLIRTIIFFGTFQVNLLIYNFFLQLKKIWADQKQSIHSLRKKYVSHLEVNTPLDRSLTTNLNASITDERLLNIQESILNKWIQDHVCK
jgi:hypothetical protein